MDNEIETTKVESEVIEQQGTTEAPATGSLDVDESESTPPVEDEVSVEELKAQIETERKERQKIEMERNQLKNKQETDRKAALEEEGNWKQLAEEREAELEAIKQKAQADEDFEKASSLRNSIINEYSNETVRNAAKALVEANPLNLAWGAEVQTEEEAREQLVAQLDKMASTLGVVKEETQDTTETDEPYVHPNNQASDGGDITLEKLKNMTAEEMKKFLPTAEPR